MGMNSLALQSYIEWEVDLRMEAGGTPALKGPCQNSSPLKPVMSM